MNKTCSKFIKPSCTNQSTDEDYLKALKTNSIFNCSYIEYQSKGDKDKNLSPKEHLNMIRPYLSDIINDHKTMSINVI